MSNNLLNFWKRLKKKIMDYNKKFNIWNVISIQSFVP